MGLKIIYHKYIIPVFNYYSYFMTFYNESKHEVDQIELMASNTRLPETNFARVDRFVNELLNRAGNSIKSGLEGADRLVDVISLRTIKVGEGLLSVAGNTLKLAIKPIQFIEGLITGPYLKDTPTEISEYDIQQALKSAK